MSTQYGLAKMETCEMCLPQCTDMMYSIRSEYIKMEDAGFHSNLT